jgi:hypothetical protein
MYYHSDAMSDDDSDYDTLYSNPKNMDVHMLPRDYDSEEDDLYFDDM